VNNYTITIPSNMIKYFHISCSTNETNLPPSANFTISPGNHITMDSVMFNDTSIDPDGIIVNWTWNLDNNSSFLQNISHAFNRACPYKINLTIRDDDNATSSKESILNIYFNIPLKYRWNLISIPFNKTINKSKIIVRWNESDYSWDAAVANGIILDYFYSWNRSTQIYDTSSLFTSGTGFWLWAFHDCSLLACENYSTERYVTKVEPQWNIIGIPTDISNDLTNYSVKYNGTEYNWINATTKNNELGTPIILNFVYLWNESS